MQETMITTSRATVGRQAKAFVLSFAQSIISFFRILEDCIYAFISISIDYTIGFMIDLFKDKIQNIGKILNENNNENVHGFINTSTSIYPGIELTYSAFQLFQNEDIIAKDEVSKNPFDKKIVLENRFLIVLKLSLNQIQGLLSSIKIKFFSIWLRINPFYEEHENYRDSRCITEKHR